MHLKKIGWLMILFLILCLNFSYGYSPGKNYLEIYSRKSGNGDALYAKSNCPGEITILLQVSGTNLSFSRSVPLHMVIPSRANYEILRISPRTNAGWNYRYEYKYGFGNFNARHNDGYVYQLPYQKGKAFKVMQTYGGSYSHQNELYYCIDFQMPVGTPICAAREGQVTAFYSSSNEGGANKSLYWGKENYIIIRHNDGTVAAYLHLQRNGVSVREGQYVSKGQVIGFSGNTGWSGTPHLHFGVYRATGDPGVGGSLPVQMATNQGILRRLAEGIAYR